MQVEEGSAFAACLAIAAFLFATRAAYFSSLLWLCSSASACRREREREANGMPRHTNAPTGRRKAWYVVTEKYLRCCRAFKVAGLLEYSSPKGWQVRSILKSAIRARAASAAAAMFQARRARIMRDLSRVCIDLPNTNHTFLNVVDILVPLYGCHRVVRFQLQTSLIFKSNN